VITDLRNEAFDVEDCLYYVEVNIALGHLSVVANGPLG